MSKSIFRVLGLVASLIVSGGAMASNDLIGFNVGFNKACSIWKIDTSTGGAVSLSQFESSFNEGTFISSFNFSYFYDSSRIMKINMLTGEVSVLATILDVRGIQIAQNGDLICLTQDFTKRGRLWKIDPATGVIVDLFQFYFESAISSGTFITSFNFSYFYDSGRIHKINMLTRDVNVLATLEKIRGIQIAENGDLICLREGFSNGGSLLKIDPVTGVVTQLPCYFQIRSLVGLFVVIDNHAYIGQQDSYMYKINLTSLSVATLPQNTNLRGLASTAPIAEIPVVTYVQPISGPASGGTAVNINGINFPNSVSVLFGGVAATDVVVVSPTLITAVTPAGVSGMSVVTVNGVGGEAFYYRSICQSDLDGSGVVDSSDLGIMLLDFGSCSESAAVAPQQEPLILQAPEPAKSVPNKK
jgi:hypothetical protein